MDNKNATLLKDLHKIYINTLIEPEEALKIKEKNPELFEALKLL